MSQFISKILAEAALLKVERIVSFPNESFGNFVLMMGSPGAGKTFISSRFLNLRSFKHLAGDNWLELVAKRQNLDLKDPQVTSDLNSKYEKSFGKFRRSFIELQLDKSEPANIVVDITGKSLASVRKALDVVEGSQYTTTLVYVVTSKEECLKRNLQRDRVVPPDFLMSVYDLIQETYNQVFNDFDHVWMVTNNDVWAAFQGEEEYVIVDGKKYLKSRTGTYERPSERIHKVK